MKKINLFLILMTWIMLPSVSQAQYPACFQAPWGIFIMIDSAFHAGASLSVQRSDNHGAYTTLPSAVIPKNEKEFFSLLRKAEKNFPQQATAGEQLKASWWKGISQGKPNAMFLMSPAGMLASGMADFDRDVQKGNACRYRILFSDEKGTRELLSNEILYSGNMSLPRPAFVSRQEDAGSIGIQFGYTPRITPSQVSVFRKTEGSQEFREIPFRGGFSNMGDSTLITCIDTAVDLMKEYSYCVKLRDWLGNEFPVSDTAVGRAYSQLAAPVINRLYIKPVTSNHAIRLSWDAVKSPGVRGIFLFRSGSRDGKYSRIATLTFRDTAYVDVVPLANENYWYFAVVANRFGYGNPGARVFAQVSLNSNPFKPQRPGIRLKQNKPVISLRASGANSMGFVVYRGEGYHGELRQVSVHLSLSDTAYVDSCAVNGRSYCYAYAVLGEGSGLSPRSDSVSIQVPSAGHISIPFNLKAFTDGTCVNLFWENMLLSDGLVNGYRVYRRLEGENQFTRLTAVALSSYSNSFRDSVTFPGRVMEYCVTSVDPGGIESPMSAPLGIQTLNAGRTGVSGIMLRNTGGKVIISWARIIDSSLKSYRIFRFTENSEPSEIGLADAVSDSFSDNSPLKGNLLLNYYVNAVYSDGTETETEEIPGIRLP